MPQQYTTSAQIRSVMLEEEHFARILTRAMITGQVMRLSNMDRAQKMRFFTYLSPWIKDSIKLSLKSPYYEVPN